MSIPGLQQIQSPGVVITSEQAIRRKPHSQTRSTSNQSSNHNMDPSVVGSPSFGQIFKTALPGNYNGDHEQVFAQPLVYTTSDGVQYVYLATTQNNIYKINAKTGVIVLSRNLHIPFLTADLDGCVDINPHIGITATGVIDPVTNTLYLISKTYTNQRGGTGPQGRPAGRYYVHAIDVHDLTERMGFPVDLEGIVARNNHVSLGYMVRWAVSCTDYHCLDPNFQRRHSTSTSCSITHRPIYLFWLCLALCPIQLHRMDLGNRQNIGSNCRELCYGRISCAQHYSWRRYLDVWWWAGF